MRILKIFLLIMVAMPVLAMAQTGQLSRDEQIQVERAANKLKIIFSRPNWISENDQAKVFSAIELKDGVIVSTTPQYRDALQRIYKDMTGKNLVDEFNYLPKNKQLKAKLELQQGSLKPLDVVANTLNNAAITGSFTTSDRSMIVRAAIALREAGQDLNNINQEWQTKYGTNGRFLNLGNDVLTTIKSRDSNTTNTTLVDKLLTSKELLSDVEVSQLSRLADVPEPTIKAINNVPQSTMGAITEDAESAEFLKFKKDIEQFAAGSLTEGACGPRGDGSYRLCTPVPGFAGDVRSLGDYIRSFFVFFLGMAGLLVMFRIVWGGILYATSAGNTSKQSEAKDIIYMAIWGLVLLFAAGFILRIINPQILQFGEAIQAIEIVRPTQKVEPVNLANFINNEQKSSTDYIKNVRATQTRAPAEFKEDYEFIIRQEEARLEKIKQYDPKKDPSGLEQLRLIQKPYYDTTFFNKPLNQ